MTNTDVSDDVSSNPMYQRKENFTMRNRMILTIICMTIVLPFLLIAGASYSGAAGVAVDQQLEGSFVPNEILIGLQPQLAQQLDGRTVTPNHMGIASLDQLNARYIVQQISPVFTDVDANDTIAATYGLAGVFRLTVPDSTDIFQMISDYQADPNIAYAEPNRIYAISDMPNDTDFKKQWALNNTGQTGGKPDADIDAPEAWNLEKGKPNVLIAIVDTGVDYTHPDLAGGRIRTDIDRDFVNNDNDAMDDHGHGTYVTGIAAANTNNARGIAGVCRNCQILPVKVLNSEGSGTSQQVAAGIQYAADAGAKIVSMSLGFPSSCGCSQTVARAINYAFEHGSLLIAASGNDSDKGRLSYPSSSPRVLSVGASDHKDQEASFSNRSPALDILAPGKDIYSLALKGGYRTADGTSAATPHVSGVAGLIWSARPNLKNVEVWWILYQSANSFQSAVTLVTIESATGAVTEMPEAIEGQYNTYLPLMSKMQPTFGRLNAYQALITPAAGQIQAPVDTCSSEPSCPPGCGAEVVLSVESTASDDLQILRAFRDQVLARSRLGQYWTELYERHRIEVAFILATNGEFRAQARSALKQWLPLIDVLANPATTHMELLTTEYIESAEAVVEDLGARGSFGLRADLEEAREILITIRQYVDMDIREAWKDLNATYQ